MEKVLNVVFGTAKIDKCIVADVVKESVKVGFRAFDTAAVYGNEEGVGDAFEELLVDGVVERSEIYVIGKIFMADYRCVESACETSLRKLKTGYIDLMLLHWPIALKHDYQDFSIASDKIDRFPLFLQ